VVSNRQPNAEQFEEEHERQVGEKAYLVLVGLRSADRGGVRDEDVFEQKRADRDDARQGMQTPQQKRRPLTSTQRCNALP
jgi:hypothetical protein